jgi:hypothetical protein
VRIVFDLDETLVHTREAVRQAYLGAGVVMPDDAFGKPFYEWNARTLDNKLIHHRKHQLYPEMVQRFAERTPLLDDCIARKLTIEIITGASYDATVALRFQNRLLPATAIIHKCSLNRMDKVHWLAKNGWGIYVDDDAATLALVKEFTTWKVLSPEECLRSFSQLEPTLALMPSLRHLANHLS